MASLPQHLSRAPVGREQLSREVLSEHQRDRILTAATGVFAKRGYQGTTVDHIVSAAQVAVGSFYALFDGKEDCFVAAYDRIIAQGRERLSVALPADRPWPEQLVICLRALLELIEADPLAARIALVEVQTAGPAGLAVWERTLEEAADLLRAGREHSSFPDELPATLEFATIGGLVWFLQQRVVQGEAASAEKLLPEALEIVAGPYLGEAASAALIAAG